jgi:hypothetical protein
MLPKVHSRRRRALFCRRKRQDHDINEQAVGRDHPHH